MQKQIVRIFLYLALCTGISVFTVLNIQQGKPDLWKEWKNQYAIKYLNREEEIYRKAIFQQNLKEIIFHNTQAHTSYTLGLSQFADLTESEFIETHLHFLNDKIDHKIDQSNTKTIDQIDWTTQGAVSPIRNSGMMCAASYAWSALGALQGYKAVKTKSLILYSWQQIVDCSKQFGNQGCQGSVIRALQYVKQKGISTDKDYPYVGNLETCKANEDDKFKIKDYKNLNSCQQIKTALQVSPISVHVDASKFMFYQSGIFDNCQNNLNLAVVLVGMNNQYWKLKLNWGTSWGENGFIRIAQGNTCGICQMGASVLQ